MPIEANPINDMHDFYHVTSDRAELYDQPSAMLLDQLFAHLEAIRLIGQGVGHDVLAARLRDLYQLDVADDRQRQALLIMLSQEVGRIAQAYAQSLSYTLTPEDRRQMQAEIQAQIQAQIPNLRGDLEAYRAAIKGYSSKTV